jgi:hypothetical protein
MKQGKSTYSVILAAVILLSAMLSCYVDEKEDQINLFDQYYTIEPTSLLDSLKHGEMAFTPVSQRPELIPFDQQVTVNWSQADYFYIANALYEGAVGKTLLGWQLGGVDFSLTCSQIQNGFQNGRFHFFSVIKVDDEDSRLERFIDIDPRHNFVNASESKYFPNLVDSKSIDMAGLKISAEQALQIAESNRGQETRQSVGNDCHIDLFLSPRSRNTKGWKVMYHQNDDKLFEIQIDSYTGEID